MNQILNQLNHNVFFAHYFADYLYENNFNCKFVKKAKWEHSFGHKCCGGKGVLMKNVKSMKELNEIKDKFLKNN